jgi:hypothetical protein
MAVRQSSVRLAVEGAEQARAQLEAVKAAARNAGEGSAPSATAIRQWESLSRGGGRPSSALQDPIEIDLPP